MVDKEKIRRMMMKGFGAISKGKNLEDRVFDGEDLGRDMVIGKALTYGGALAEDFTDLELEIVQLAFKRFRAEPPSRSTGDCCAEMLRLTPRRGAEAPD